MCVACLNLESGPPCTENVTTVSVEGIIAATGAGGLAELRHSLEQGLRGPVSQPTLEILLNEQAELKVCIEIVLADTLQLRLLTT